MPAIIASKTASVSGSHVVPLGILTTLGLEFDAIDRIGQGETEPVRFGERGFEMFPGARSPTSYDSRECFGAGSFQLLSRRRLSRAWPCFT